MKHKFYTDRAAPCFRCGGTIAEYTTDDATSLVDVLCHSCRSPDLFCRSSNITTASECSAAHRSTR